MKTLLKVLFKAFVLIMLTFNNSYGQLSQETSNALWKGVGGKQKWDSTNYILFTANGNSSFLQTGRRFLLDKQTGQVRFEGRTNNGDNIVALFNFKTAKLAKLFLNGKEVKQSPEATDELFAKISEQLTKDSSLLFIATLIDRPETKKGKIVSRRVNAEKLQVLPFQLKDGLIAGELLYNEDTGLIKQIVDKSGDVYYVNGYKDIGDGIFLPTVFKNLEDPSKNTTYTTVAAFSEIEKSKFSNL